MRYFLRVLHLRGGKAVREMPDMPWRCNSRKHGSQHWIQILVYSVPVVCFLGC